ncbi:cysteine desulfurase family protein [Anaerolineales bacterium]
MRHEIYLDYSATTPTDPRVLEVMLPYFTENYGNASSIHRIGRRAEQAIEDAREAVAKVLACKPGEIVFTSCGSESDNLAIRGVAWQARHNQLGNHLITSLVEHNAVLRTVKQMTDFMDFESSFLPLEKDGTILPETFEAMIQDNTVLASVMYANNEVGTISPIPELARIARDHDVLFHTDAVQAGGQLNLNVQQLAVDLMSISSHKFYGPKGVGALYVKNGIELTPSQSGGSHENGRRAGTHNTPLIVGLAKALTLAYEEIDLHVAHYQKMRDLLIEGVLEHVPDCELTGNRNNRLPSHASFIFNGIDGNQLLMFLDLKGVFASSGSACKTGNPEPSNVLMALGYTPAVASGTLRVTVGRQTTAEDIEFAVQAIAECVEKMRQLTSEINN